jgi:hypothetical protein
VIDDFPTIPRPIARGASVCHVLAVRDWVGTYVAACGIPCGGFCGPGGFEEGMTTCPTHDEPLCPECVEIVQEFACTGVWTGVEGEPHEQGAHHIACWEPGCGETLWSKCWCYEHLAICDEDDCTHGAHACDAAVHYCDRHAEGR